MLLVVGLAAAALALALYLGVERLGTAGLPLAALRAVCWGVVAALLVNPALRRAGGTGTTVLLDQSLSMLDASGDARWRAAVDSARSLAGRGGRIVLFGAEPLPWTDGARAVAATSRLAPALKEAAAHGGNLAVVTDGAVDDAGAVPTDVLRRARVVVVPRPAGPDAGVAALDLPAALRAGDTAVATLEVLTSGTDAGDTAVALLLEQGRVVARARFPVGAGGSLRRELRFLPAPVAGEREVRRYEARLSGLSSDVEPRDDARATVAAVTRASAIVLLTDSPDWDSRALAVTLGATAGVPVRVFVRMAAGAWRDARTLRSVAENAVRGEASRASLLVAHGSEDGVEAASRLGGGGGAAGAVALGDHRPLRQLGSGRLVRDAA